VKSSRFMTSMLTLIALAALTTSCGTTSTPTSPGNSLDSTPPPAPTELSQGIDVGTGGGSLEWSASTAGDVAGYQVYVYQPSPTRDNAYIQVATTAPGVTSWDLPGVSLEQTQYFRVRAVDVTGNRSGFSAEFAATLSPATGGGTTATGPDAPGHEDKD
jgi:hypothetical protein